MRALLLLPCVVSVACFDPTKTPGDGGDSSGTDGTESSSATMTTSPTTAPTSTGPDESSSTTADPPTSTTVDPDGTGTDTDTGVPPLACVESVLDPDVGAALVEVNTSALGDDFTGSCGGGGAPDAAYEWRVPYDGFFILDTAGSAYDTVLYALDGACDGPEIACSDNGQGVGYSEIVAPFTADQRVVIVLDGAAGEDGDAQLNITEVGCPSADVSDQALPQTFSNIAGTNTHGGMCGGDGNPERAFRWTAPAAGLYAFVATSDAFVPAVYVERGPICGGPLLGCNADPSTERGEVVRELAAGEFVTVVVDSTGGAGEFELDIVEIAAQCPGDMLDFNPFAGDINDYEHHMTSSCGPDGYIEGPSYNPFADATFSWTSPGKIGANSGCDITVTSGFPTALSLQEGSCDGAEVQCVTSNFQPGPMNYVGTLSVGHIPPTDFTVTVSPTSPNFFGWVTSDFLIEIGCFAIG